MSRAEARKVSEGAEREERQRRSAATAICTLGVRALAASASPRIRPDRSAVAAELKALRSFHANAKQKALALDVELIDLIVELLGG